MQHADLIEELGGTGQVVSDLEAVTGRTFSPSAVSNWKCRGVPWRWRSAVKTIAKRKGVTLPEDFGAA